MSAEKSFSYWCNIFLAAQIVELLSSKGYEFIGNSSTSLYWTDSTIFIQKGSPLNKLFETVQLIDVSNAFDGILKKHSDITYVFHTAHWT